MNVTVNVVDHPGVRVTGEDVQAAPPDAVEFVVEGAITVSGDLLGELSGRRLRPVAVTLAVDESTETVDLQDEAALRLKTLDVGVETPGADDLPSGGDGLGSVGSGVSGGTDAGAIAFTVEGIIAGIQPENFDALSGGSLRVESITFAVDDARATDGGMGDDVVLEFTLLGYVVVVRRDGTVTILRE